MATVRDLITGSLRLLGAVASGEAPAPNELADGLSVLNEMIDSWSNESLMVYAQVRESFLLTAAQASYTIGTGGNFNTSRPTALDIASIEIQTNPLNEIAVEILNLAQWSEIAVKSTTGAIPTKIYLEDTFPLATVNLWPVPSVPNKLILYSTKPLSGFASINDVVILPPGYAKALRYGLAIELAPEYAKQLDQSVVAGAIGSKAALKVINSEPNYLETDPALVVRGRSFNWRTGV